MPSSLLPIGIGRVVRLAIVIIIPWTACPGHPQRRLERVGQNDVTKNLLVQPIRLRERRHHARLRAELDLLVVPSLVSLDLVGELAPSPEVDGRDFTTH